MSFKVVLRPQAEADLESIYHHVEKDSPARAIKYIRRLRERCDSLRYLPERGRPRDDILPGLRIRLSSEARHRISDRRHPGAYRGYLLPRTGFRGDLAGWSRR